MLVDYYLPIVFLNVKAVTYLLVYNYTLLLLVTAFLDKEISNITSLNLILSSNDRLNFTNLISSLALMSMAGVPPFVGFFTKLFIVVSVMTNSFVYVIPFMVLILLLGLYFYQQNIRYILSSSNSRSSFMDKSGVMYILSEGLLLSEARALILLIIVFGSLLLDEVTFYVRWVLL